MLKGAARGQILGQSLVLAPGKQRGWGSHLVLSVGTVLLLSQTSIRIQHAAVDKWLNKA